MFDISGPELLTILMVALIVFGPKRLPDLARRVGGWASELRRAATELRTGLERDVASLQEPLEEAKEELEKPLREAKEAIEEPIREAQEQLDGVTQNSDVSWVGPEPESGPTSSDALSDLEEIERTGRPATEPEEETS